LCHVAKLPESWRQNAADAKSQLLQLLPRNLPHGMPGSDVSDLVSHHSGEFRLIAEIGKNATRQVNVTAGDSKRIDDGRIHHREWRLQLRPVRHGHELPPHGLRVIL